MIKFIFYKNPDGTLFFQSFSKEFAEGKTDEDLLNIHFHQPFDGLPKTLFNSCGLEPNKHTGTCCDFPAADNLWNYYLDDSGKLQPDNNYDVLLMPREEIWRKHRDRMLVKIDAELAKQTPDAVALTRFQRSIDSLKVTVRFGHSDSKDIYVQAVANLDEDVANGKPDKTVIRQKLQDKINSLTESKNVQKANAPSP